MADWRFLASDYTMTFSFSLSRSFTHMTSTNTGQVAGQRVTCRCLALRADCPGHRLSLTRDQHHTPVEPTPEPGCATCPWGAMWLCGLRGLMWGGHYGYMHFFPTQAHRVADTRGVMFPLCPSWHDRYTSRFMDVSTITLSNKHNRLSVKKLN